MDLPPESSDSLILNRISNFCCVTELPLGATVRGDDPVLCARARMRSFFVLVDRIAATRSEHRLAGVRRRSHPWPGRDGRARSVDLRGFETLRSLGANAGRYPRVQQWRRILAQR